MLIACCQPLPVTRELASNSTLITRFHGGGRTREEEEEEEEGEERRKRDFGPALPLGYNPVLGAQKNGHYMRICDTVWPSNGR